MNPRESWDLIVIGAGAAGMLGADAAARRGVKTLLLEKNTKPGVKILISGGTRCNLTHATNAAGMLSAFPKQQARFLRTAFSAFGPERVVEHFNQLGVPTKTEPNGKIFPLSDRAYDVQQALWHRLIEAGVEAKLSTPVTSISHDVSGQLSAQQTATSQSQHPFVVRTETDEFRCHNLLLTTGGKSYSGCGTTGDAYAWLRQLGHTIVPPRPALVPLVASAPWIADLSGLTLEDVLLRVAETKYFEQSHEPEQTFAIAKKRELSSRRSSLLFAHFGLTGPAAMDVSGAITAHENMLDVRLLADFVPTVEVSQLRQSLEQRIRSNGAQTVSRAVSEHVPTRLANHLVTLSGIPQDRRLAELGKLELRQLLTHLKATPIAVSGTRGFPKAEVTAGGAKLSEINPKSMESRKVPGLYVAGELLDVDGRIGGYNFQSAFSTGWLASQKVTRAQDEQSN